MRLEKYFFKLQVIEVPLNDKSTFINDHQK